MVLDTGAHSPTDNDHWHTDMTYAHEPPMAGVLYSRLLPTPIRVLAPPLRGDKLRGDEGISLRPLSISKPL